MYFSVCNGRFVCRAIILVIMFSSPMVCGMGYRSEPGHVLGEPQVLSRYLDSWVNEKGKVLLGKGGHRSEFGHSLASLRSYEADLRAMLSRSPRWYQYVPSEVQLIRRGILHHFIGDALSSAGKNKLFRRLGKGLSTSHDERIIQRVCQQSKYFENISKKQIAKVNGWHKIYDKWETVGKELQNGTPKTKIIRRLRDEHGIKAQKAEKLVERAKQASENREVAEVAQTAAPYLIVAVVNGALYAGGYIPHEDLLPRLGRGWTSVFGYQSAGYAVKRMRMSWGEPISHLGRGGKEASFSFQLRGMNPAVWRGVRWGCFALVDFAVMTGFDVARGRNISTAAWERGQESLVVWVIGWGGEEAAVALGLGGASMPVAMLAVLGGQYLFDEYVMGHFERQHKQKMRRIESNQRRRLLASKIKRNRGRLSSLDTSDPPNSETVGSVGLPLR